MSKYIYGFLDGNVNILISKEFNFITLGFWGFGVLY